MQLFISRMIIASIVSLAIAACNNEKDTKEENKTENANSSTPAKALVFDKLVGVWQSEDGKSFEQWTKNENGTYRTGVYSLKGSDTAWAERGNVYPENDKWIYENTAIGQNQDKAIKFTSTMLEESKVQFSNPAHDFPTDINYTVPDANTVNAFIVGPNKAGGKDTIPFNYKRVTVSHQ